MHKFANKKVLHVALCGILAGGMIGCDSDQETPLDWQGNSCGVQGTLDLLTGLNATEQADGIILIKNIIGLGPLATVGGGEPCSQAMDVAMCNTDLDTASQNGVANSLILTFGDEVRVLDNPDAIKAFLGDLDTPQKVMLWMHANGLPIECDFARNVVAETDNGQSWVGVYTEFTSSCAPIVEHRITVSISRDGTIEETGRKEVSRSANACIGRVPPGDLTVLNNKPGQDDSAVGRLFAKHAAYEAASVVAFDHLKAELKSHGAPQAILDKIETAANDERRHAEQVDQLAQQYGHSADSFSVDTSCIRDLESIALDNFQEGCIGETWGALVGLYQAENAGDRKIRETMQQIAIDEVGHAALSWEIHAWLLSQLDGEAQQRILARQDETINRLQNRVLNTAVSDYEQAAGLPTHQSAQYLFEKLRQTLVGPTQLVS